LTKPALLIFLVPAGVVAGVLVAMGAQTRLGMWPQLAMPNFAKVFSFGGIKRLFNKDTLIDLGIAALKVTALGYTLWSTFRATFMALPNMLHLGIAEQLEATYRPIGKNLAKILTLVTVMAGADFALVRYRYLKRMKMTKEEAKREYKEESGDPMIRARRKRRHRELAKGQARLEVPKADALIVNPTHIAIAIRYRPEEDAAPRVTAKGKGVLAEMMRDLARENGVPIVEDIPLARLLYKRVKVGRCVPAETFKAVAAVLAYVYRVLGKTPMHAGGRR
jgi:flagellar biosynthetic protein FlhB